LIIVAVSCSAPLPCTRDTPVTSPVRSLPFLGLSVSSNTVPFNRSRAGVPFRSTIRPRAMTCASFVGQPLFLMICRSCVCLRPAVARQLPPEAQLRIAPD